MGPNRRFVPWLLLALVASGTGLGLGLGLAGAPSRGPASVASGPTYYVSLGDSYSVGYQPGPGATRQGYANDVVREEARLGKHLTLENFGCAGATTASILDRTGCAVPALGGAPYGGRTQAAAAERFIAAHRGRIGLVTVSIGGNDVTACAVVVNPLACIAGAVTSVRTNVARLAGGLRTAAGPKVPIIGLTYPDVILGKWVYPPVSRTLATVSVVAFKTLINPALAQTYASAGGTLVDVTAATGAYTPLTRTESVSPYGTVPYSVAQICKLTYFCSQGNIHANATGYGIIGNLIVRQLSHRR